jgi:hypothetical protein
MVERIKLVIDDEIHESLERCDSQRRRFELCEAGECVQDWIRPKVSDLNRCSC